MLPLSISCQPLLWRASPGAAWTGLAYTVAPADMEQPGSRSHGRAVLVSICPDRAGVCLEWAGPLGAGFWRGGALPALPAAHPQRAAGLPAPHRRAPAVLFRLARCSAADPAAARARAGLDGGLALPAPGHGHPHRSHPRWRVGTADPAGGADGQHHLRHYRLLRPEIGRAHV